MNAIYILWYRQVLKYFRSRSRIIGSLGQPLLFLIVFGFGFGGVFQKAGEGNYLQFLAPGIILMSVLFTAVFNGIDLIWERQFGFLKETLVAPISRLSIMIGKTLGGATVATIQGLIVFFLTLPLGFRPANPILLPLTFGLIFLVAVLFTSLGIAIASTLEDIQGFQLIMNFLVMPTFFLSGALFPREGLPEVLNIVTTLDPLTYGVDAIRRLLTASPSSTLIPDTIILAVVTIFLLVLGSYLFEKIQV